MLTRPTNRMRRKAKIRREVFRSGFSMIAAIAVELWDKRVWTVAMIPERWRQIAEVFHAAVQHAPENRQQFLEDAARDDADLLLEVESLLPPQYQPGTSLDPPALLT